MTGFSAVVKVLLLLCVADFLAACTAGEFQVDPHDCQSYFQCLGGKLERQTCPEGLLFEPTKKACNHNHIVNCGTRPDLTVSKGGTITCPRSHGTFANRHDCRSFFQCTAFKPVLLTCPADLIFDYIKQACEYPDTASCISPVTTTTSAPTTTPRPTTTPTTTTTPAPTTTPTTTTTPAPTTTPTTTTTPAPTTTPTTTPVKTPSPTPSRPPSTCSVRNGMFEDVDDCRKYFRCTNWVAVHEKCPTGLRYNPKNKACNDLDIVSCAGRRVVHDPAEDVRRGLCRRAHGTFAHPTDCSKYILCINFKPTEISCPPDLKFDTVTKDCLHSAEAHC